MENLVAAEIAIIPKNYKTLWAFSSAFLLFGEEAGFAEEKCEWVAKWIRVRDVVFVLDFFECGGSESFWLQLSKFFEVICLIPIWLLPPHVDVAVYFVLINLTIFPRYKMHANIFSEI